MKISNVSIWYPIIWDKVYWNNKINKIVKQKYWLDRQALHAQRLGLKFSNSMSFSKKTS